MDNINIAEYAFLKKCKKKKMKNLKKNIDFLNELSLNIDNSIKQLKDFFEKINNNKEELKLKIQKIFTNLRNALNNREDKLLEEIDNQYNELFCNESLIKKSEEKYTKDKNIIRKRKFNKR